jgi:hypothetical protein
MPALAWFARTSPSNWNGRVTTAITNGAGFSDFAIRATTGAQPVPVPPPMPAVMNNMSAS